MFATDKYSAHLRIEQLKKHATETNYISQKAKDNKKSNFISRLMRSKKSA